MKQWSKLIKASGGWMGFGGCVIALMVFDVAYLSLSALGVVLIIVGVNLGE